MTDDQVRAAIQIAVQHLKEETPVLDFGSVHERSTAHQLAVHMEPLFGPEWNIDCEYDRDGYLKKALSGIAECGKQKHTNNIFPDIIVHHRRGAGRDNNLLVIELKKQAARDACDWMKLELLTSATGHYQYHLGLYVNIDGGGFTQTWFKDGVRQ